MGRMGKALGFLAVLILSALIVSTLGTTYVSDTYIELTTSTGETAAVIYNNGTARFYGEVQAAGLNVDGGTLYVDAANNRVGIGTTAPGSYKLNVAGTTYIGNTLTVYNDQKIYNTIRFYDSDLTTQRGRILGSNTGLQLGYGEATHLTIDTSGNVGIGTTAPSGKLHVSGGNAIFDGNVGIGTTLPTQALHVYGSGTKYIQIESTNSEATFIWKNAQGESYFGIAGSAGNLITGQTAAGDLALSHRTGGKIILSADSGFAEAHLTITESGNVGIGTTNPAEKLTLPSTGKIAWENGTAGVVDVNLYRSSVDTLRTDDTFVA
ncbi:MAG: hypothetical protein FGF50_08675, partial [Candidatus Brockarchaeota archaeon]|nr:hypothetical protein [Candidatus Brockarchaeota archaeon]